MSAQVSSGLIGVLDVLVGEGGFGDWGIGTRSLQYFLITQFKSNVKCYRRQDFRILNARNRRLMDKYVKTFVS